MNERDLEIIKLYESGMSSIEIGEKFNSISVRHIQRIIKASGKTRGIKEAWNNSVSRGRRNFDSFHKTTYGYVYLMKNEYGRFKIGFSMSPVKNRLVQFEGMGGVRLELLYSKYFDNASDIEADLIRKYWDKHLFREWFEFKDEDVESIKQVLQSL